MATITDLKALGYTLGEAFTTDNVTVYHVDGNGVSSYLRGDDQPAIDQLADPAAHAERRFQSLYPAAADARRRLEANGYSVTRPDPTADVFKVVQTPTPGPTQVKTIAELDAATPADLITAADQLTAA